MQSNGGIRKPEPEVKTRGNSGWFTCLMCMVALLVVCATIIGVVWIIWGSC